jgi:phosphatidylglycerol:prolipoprotein diacylglycerol transferase
MLPYLNIFGFHLPTFGLMLWLAAVAAAFVMDRNFKRAGLDADAVGMVAITALLGIVGAKLWHVIDTPAEFRAYGWRVLWDSAGFAWYGGLLFGISTLMFQGWWAKIGMLRTLDLAAPAAAIGYAIGRIGCFLNGDDYGTLTRLRWAVVFPSGTEAYTAHLSNGWIRPGDSWSLPVHPTQLYASLLGLGLFAILGSWRAKRPGDRLWLFFLLYGASRFLLEYFRGDFHPVLGALSLPQLFSLGLIAAGIILGTRGRGWFVWRTGRLVADPGTAVIS